MLDHRFGRRRFVQAVLAAGAAPGALLGSGQALGAIRPAALPIRDAELAWLDGTPPAGGHEGTSWGVPWPRGSIKGDAAFGLAAADGAALPVQSWTAAWWPDGSVKWSAHAIPAGAAQARLKLTAARPAAPEAPVHVREAGDAIEVTSGTLRWRVARSGEHILLSGHNGTRETLRNVGLIATAQGSVDEDVTSQRRFASAVERTTVEQSGPVRAVIRVEGRHKGDGRAWLPFTMRLYFHAGSAAVRIVHSFVFDGDEKRDFIRGLGLGGTVPMEDLPHDRHIRFAGTDGGIWGEAVRPLTGLRRDAGRPFREAQVAGLKTPPIAEMAAPVRERLQYIPEWGDFRLSQPNADGFTIAKRTKAGHGWIDADGGTRADGLGYVGGAAGGVAFGIGDFWKRCPVGLDVRDAHGDAARFTLWYHSPDAPAMDMRFYHDGLGMDAHAEQNEGLDITYEDYEPGWGAAHGIARTTEFMLWALPATPSREKFAQMAASVARPPRLICPPERMHAAGVFGDWSLIDRSTPARKAIEEQNDALLAFYMGQVEQRRWYGFWNYGDVMHTYDADRHVWRYDIGGFAWDNSELSPDLWLWYSFLRSGRADLFRFAEAMTRHTGEVDVYHIGPKRGMGTRHGVQHWGDSSKQPRVSNAAYRRIYYYLTADERVGDLMRELIGSDETLTRVEIGRKVGARSAEAQPPGGASAMAAEAPPPAGQVYVGFGTTWSSLAAAWLTEWERTRDKRWRDRLLTGMNSIAALPKQWFAGGANYELATGRFTGPGDKVSVSHLNAVFGAVEVHAELFQLLDVPAYKKAWLDYCVAYNAPELEFRAMTGSPGRGRNLKQGHSRLTAYAARELHDPALAKRAWVEFFGGEAGMRLGVTDRARRIEGPNVLKPVDEAAGVSTNAAAQWGLAAIQNLALAGDIVEEAYAASRS
jgi:hypothetical protein